MVFPSLRTIPNDTHASLSYTYGESATTGLHSFAARPHLPRNWDRMKLADIHAFGSVFDLVVTRAGDRFRIETVRGGKVVDTQVVAPGDAVTIRLAE